MKRVSLVVLIPVLAAGCNETAQTPVASHDPHSQSRDTTVPDDPIPAAVRRQLGALGYLGGVEQAPRIDGVLVHDPARSYEGVNLYVAGHATEAILVDMEGSVLHTWRGQPEVAKGEPKANQKFWNRAHLFPSGDILILHGDIKLVKLDKESNVLWEYPHRVHHDMDILQDGRIYVLARKTRIVPSINSTRPIVEDFVVLLDPDGRELKRVSIPMAFENGGHRGVMRKLARGPGL